MKQAYAYRRKSRVPTCHSDRPHLAKGLCRSCYRLADRHANPEKYAEYRARRRIQDRERYRDNPGKFADRNLRALYGLSLEDYENRLRAQGGVCAICGAASVGKRFDVDHDHETGAVRGLLCTSCNNGLRHFGESLDTLHAAVFYLRGAAA